MTEQHQVFSQIQSKLGPGATWQPDQSLTATVWPLQSFDLVWVPDHRKDSDLRSVWHTRSRGGAQPVIVIAPSEQPDRVRVLGPEDPQSSDWSVENPIVLDKEDSRATNIILTVMTDRRIGRLEEY